MLNFILYSDIDQTIQDRMANQAPDINRRLRAVSDELDMLQNQYDLFDTIRSININVITDGSVAYDVSTIVADNDVKTIKDFSFNTDDDGVSPIFIGIDLPEFKRKMNLKLGGNYYCLYTENGIQYLRVMTINPQSTQVTLIMTYHTTHKAMDNSNDFIPNVINSAGIKVLLPQKFKELVALGAVKRLFYPAKGETDQAALNKIEKAYKEIKETLGLIAASPTKKRASKIRMRPLV